MFIDETEIFIKAGSGGNGAVAFRREKFVPKGGPSGGNGGKGGDVIFSATGNLNTLLNFRHKKNYNAEDGKPGGTSLKDGKNGNDLILKVPIGTIISNVESGNVISDLETDNKTVIAARGGRGGKGNSNFATSTNQAPRYAQKGKPGDERKVKLELKLIADVGLVGFPNAGKSTLISVISAAKPKIAGYPFTTLQPNLGIVKYKDEKSFTMADIPGIIEGAHTGKGLGIQFLKHIERTKILLILIDISAENIREQYNILSTELKKYSPVLSSKPKIIALSKADLLLEDDLETIKKIRFPDYNDDVKIFSSISKIGLSNLIEVIWRRLAP